VRSWKIPKGIHLNIKKNSKFDRHKDNSDEEDDKEEDSTRSHDSGFARLGREQEEEENKRKLEKANGSAQNA
jgi:hypothetical protein